MRQGCEDFALRLGALYYAMRRNGDATRVLLLGADWARSGNKAKRPPIVVMLAAIEIREQRPDKAVDVLELLLEEQDRFPERSQALFMLGETYLTKLKDRVKAKEILTRLRDEHADRFSEAAKSLLSYIELQERGVIGSDSPAEGR